MAAWVRRAGCDALPASALLITGLLLFPSAGQDDTHITCWPAYTLSHYGQMLNYNGERVEQSSSLFHVLLLAALHAVTGANLLTLAKLTSIGGGVASLVALSILVSRVATRAAGVWAALMAAVATPLVYWSFSGMETTIVAAAALALIITAADYLSGDRRASTWKLSAALVAFATVRPEAPLLMAAVLGAVVLTPAVAERVGISCAWSGVGRARPLSLLVLATCVCAALFVFRWLYFGAFWPQPVAAKFAEVSWQTIVTGVQYAIDHAWNIGSPTKIVTTILVISLFVTLAQQLRAGVLNVYVWLAALFACGSFAFVITSGGDWMPGGRFLAHFLPIAIAFIPLAAGRIGSRSWMLPVIGAVVIALELGSAALFARTGSTSFPLWARLAKDYPGPHDVRFSWFERHSRINVRDMAVINALDPVVARVFAEKGEPVVVMSGQMGMVTYHITQRHFGRVRFVDRHGLVERSLTDCAFTRDGSRDTGGLVMTATQYLRATATSSGCELPRPDVIFDIGTFVRSGVGAYGYAEVFRQSGAVNAVGILPGGTVLADAYIAVDSQRYPAIRPFGAARPTER